MTVKVMLLKSGEDVISDAREIMDNEQKGIVAYHLSNPFVMQLTAEENEELQVEGEEAPQTKYSVRYTHWAPLSKQRAFVIPADWLVTIYDPHDNILKDYCAKNNIDLEEETSAGSTPPVEEIPESPVEVVE
jgi:hypothetical protein